MPDLANIGQFLPLVLIFVVFYFLLIRPQQKKLKDHRAMIEAVRRGDTVVTAGGVIGKVIKVVDDATLQVEIAENVRVRVVKGTLAEVRAKGEPVKDAIGKTNGENDNAGPDKAAAVPAQKGGLLSKLFK